MRFASDVRRRLSAGVLRNAAVNLKHSTDLVISLFISLAIRADLESRHIYYEHLASVTYGKLDSSQR